MRSNVQDAREAPSTQPAEGRPDLDLPGADRPEPRPDPGDEEPQRLAERIDGKAGGIAAGEPDLLPNVEPPDAPM